jgi:23S rRNA pseudouridine1911/1915/1917 synthase
MANGIEEQILFEDNHLIVLNKRASDIVQGDKTGDTPLPDFIKVYLKEKYNKPGNVFCGVVHRLDRPTTGVVVFARTSKALERLNQQFREKETQKTYWALVEKAPTHSEGKLVHFLKKNEAQNKSYVVDVKTVGAKEAILHYKHIQSSERYHLLEIVLETGRHHQIRAQLAAIGCIIKGDVKYGAKRSNEDNSICLHARKLIFQHPTQKHTIEIIAPLPELGIWKQFSESD